MRPPRALRTDRLVLRRWTEADREPFAVMNADPRVMEHFPAPLTGAQSDALADRIERGFEQRGFGRWAVEHEGRFVGFTGLGDLAFDPPFEHRFEIGWRLAVEAWGKGLATEAARAALADGFTRVGLPEVVSFTAVANVRSERVMQRLGMRPDGTFDHPNVPAGSPLRRHVLYRLAAPGRAPEQPATSRPESP